MSKSVVSITRREGDEVTREIQLDLERERDAELLESLKRQRQRGELYDVKVITEQAPAKPVKRATKAAEPTE